MNHQGFLTSSESWTVGDSPHYLTGDLSIGSTVTVSVDPDCTIDLQGHILSGLGNLSLQNNTIIKSSTSGVNVNYPLIVYVNGGDSPNYVTISKNDTPNLQFNIKQRDVTNISNYTATTLTSATVTFKVAQINNISSVVVSATCSVTNATGGICTYQVQSTDFSTPGQFRAELEIAYVSQKVTVSKIVINVLNSI